MKTSYRITVYLFICILFAMGCSSDDTIVDDPKQEDPKIENPDPDGENPDNEDPNSSATTLNINIAVPEGVSIDFENAKLMAFNKEYAMETNGSSVIDYNTGAQVLTYLLDTDNNILMMGFLSSENPELSLTSSAKALLYFGLGTTFLTDASYEAFHSGADDINGFSTFVENLETLYGQDALLFSNEGFIAPLTAYLNELLTKTKVDIRAGRIEISNGTQSGLTVDNIDESNVNITNQFFRRAHAFAYKTKFRNSNGAETILNAVIEGAEIADEEVVVLPATINNSTANTLSNMIGQGVDRNNTTSETINLPLASSESEATYQIRIIGPGRNAGLQSMTDAETAKLEELLIDFMALDIVLPAFTDLLGHGSVFRKTEEDVSIISSLDGYRSTIRSAISQAPGTLDALKEGNMNEALRTLFIYLKTETVGQDVFSSIIDAVASVSNQGNSEYFVQPQTSIVNTLESLDKLLEMIGKILESNEYQNLFGDYNNANQLENWEVVVKQDDVDLMPEETATGIFSENTFTASIDFEPSNGQRLEYEWVTSGTFGTISGEDQTGVSFTTEGNTITYISQTPTAQLGENNIDTITVTIYLIDGNTRSKLGEDESTINVQAKRFAIKPSGRTIKEGESVTLYIENVDGTNPIGNNDAIEYQVRWKTQGKYGGFDGQLKEVSTFRNLATYTATDDEVKGENENISASVYFRLKGDSNWIFLDEAEGTVRINNDPEFKILHFNSDQFTHQIFDLSDENFQNIGVHSFVTIPFEEEYDIITATYDGNVGAPIRRTGTWRAGETAVAFPMDSRIEGYDNNTGTYNGDLVIAFLTTGCQGGFGGTCNMEAGAGYVNVHKELKGSLEVIIQLK